MRYLSSISLALIVHVLLSIGILLALACTATPANTPNIDATVEAAISATKTAEEAEPNLTLEMMEGILEQYYQAYKQAGYPMGGFLSGARCLRGGEMAMGNRYGDFKKSFDPKRIGREWELQVTGRYCNGVEYFFINDSNGKLTR